MEMVLTFKIILNIIFTRTEDVMEYNNMITPNIKHIIPQESARLRHWLCQFVYGLDCIHYYDK